MPTRLFQDVLSSFFRKLASRGGEEQLAHRISRHEAMVRKNSYVLPFIISKFFAISFYPLRYLLSPNTIYFQLCFSIHMQNLMSSLAPKSKPGANLFGGGRGGVLLWIQGEA